MLIHKYEKNVISSVTVVTEYSLASVCLVLFMAASIRATHVSGQSGNVGLIFGY